MYEFQGKFERKVTCFGRVVAFLECSEVCNCAVEAAKKHPLCRRVFFYVPNGRRDVIEEGCAARIGEENRPREYKGD